MANRIEFPEDKTGPALFKKYLQERGILPSTVTACGLEVASKDTALARIKYRGSSPYRHFLIIPYDDTYCVVRGLGDLQGTFAGDLGIKPAKLIAPKGAPPLYVPPLVDWSKFSGTLYLCESAIKAMVLAQYGYAAAAGNGVRGIYTNAGFVKGFPKDMLDGGQVEKVVILFDANWVTNKDVQGAVRKLATGLNQAFPKVEVIHKVLPLHEGEDQGIDDAVARQGAEWLHEWLSSEVDQRIPEVSELNRHLDELNDLYVVTKYPSMIMDRENRCRITRSEFTEVQEIDRTFMEKQPAGKGEKWVEVQPAKEWLKWSERTAAKKLMYKPGGEELCAEYYNSWYDDGVESRDGDIEPFLRVYKNAIPDAVERQLLLESMAWMMQNRGTRLLKCFALVGADQGTGKSLLVETLGVVMGDSNFASISPHNFGNNFNSSLTGREVILLDDVAQLQTNSKGLFKNFITGKSYMAEQKGKDAYKAESTAVLFITSNEFAAIPLDAEDRRVHICAFNPTKHYEQGSAWWDDYVAWLEGDGYGIIRGWLEGLDLSGYNPNFMPPMTATKRHMQQSNMHPIEAWCDDLWHHIDDELLGNKRSFYTVTELAMIYHGPGYGELDNHTKVSTEKNLLLYLQKRHRRVSGGPVRANNTRQKYWGIRKQGDIADRKDVAADVNKYKVIKLAQ